MRDEPTSFARGPRSKGARGAAMRVALAAPPFFLTAGAGWSQTLGQAPQSDVSWVRVLAALILCLGLAVGAAYVMRSRLRGRTAPFGAEGRQLELLETIRLSHQADLCVLRFGASRLLVAATAQGVTVLAQDPPACPPADAAGAPTT
jgi:flagellar biogenesis protein FliO